jgi:hypothetical protein
MDGRWQGFLLEESPDSAVFFRIQKVDACCKAGRSDPTDAKETQEVLSSYKRAIETRVAGNSGCGTR